MPRILPSKEFWIISGLVALAIILRLPTLGSPLIEDEAISFNRYIDVPWKELILTYQDTNQHTLFLLLSKFSILIFGESEVVFRFPSLLVGILSIPLTLPPRTSNKNTMAVCFNLRSINGIILAAAKVLFGGPRLRTNNVPGPFGYIFSCAVFKWFSSDMGKRFDRIRVCHDAGSPKQFIFFSGVDSFHNPCKKSGVGRGSIPH